MSTPSRSPKNRVPFVVVAVVGAALAAGALSLAGGRGRGSTPKVASPGSTGEVQSVSVVGAALPAMPKQGTDAAIGAKAPSLRGASFGGTPVVIEPGTRATLVVFVTHWCPHCQREVPLLASWMNSGRKPADVDIAFVSTSVTSGRPNYPPSKWLSTGDSNLVAVGASVLADDARSSAAEAYGLTSFPYFVMLNADGSVAERGVGELSIDDLGQLIAKARR